jgi:hypothetical protein
MKMKIIFCSIACLFLFALISCEKDNDTKKQENTTVGFIQAAIDTICSGNLRIQGTHTFVYIDSSIWSGKELYVGGFKSGDGEEIGLIIPFPVDTGHVSSFSIYYDPNNDDNDPNDATDQYGNTLFLTGADVRVENIEYSQDSTQILKIEVKANCLLLSRNINGNIDSVYVDDLIIRRD